jgi:hypothetical protein
MFLNKTHNNGVEGTGARITNLLKLFEYGGGIAGKRI